MFVFPFLWDNSIHLPLSHKFWNGEQIFTAATTNNHGIKHIFRYFNNLLNGITKTVGTILLKPLGEN